MFYILSRYINLCERNTQKIFNFTNIRKNSLWWKCQESTIGYNHKNKISCYKINTPLKYHTSNKVRRLVDSFNDERNKLMTVWPNIVNELTKDNNEELLDVNKWITEVLEYNVPKGGKRRSVSFVIACKLLTSQNQLTEENTRLAHILAWCIEIMQAVHTMADDILDHANMRRNQPAWHVKIGLFAVNDILLIETCIYKLIQKYFKSKNCYGDIMNTFLKYHRKAGYGECLDILTSTDWKKNFNFDLFSMDRYNTIIKYKTSYFSFVLPFILAMRFTNIIDPEIYKQAEKILLNIGHLFQVRDDYLDCYGKRDVIGKSGTDIQEGKCTWPLVVALQRATAKQKKILKECYGIADEEKVKRVKEIYEEIGISNIYFDYEEETHNLLNTYTEQLSSKLPTEYFLYLLATSCSKVGRKD
ncbi:farnesyl pyrophosphate synthase [Apis mellifera]|uniref:Farnesyl pyrophosphate synthase n=1 Tax=Apis mellifera TaxID=7460 RepID=A0A7M7H186_APIME|nr:farnesyl pyrophosphate synthase [Apis mellifera]|eukprot:XP_006572097.2 farnesyl pyrophosphate synthase [Apis mellifera]